MPYNIFLLFHFIIVLLLCVVVTHTTHIFQKHFLIEILHTCIIGTGAVRVLQYNPNRNMDLSFTSCVF